MLTEVQIGSLEYYEILHNSLPKMNNVFLNLQIPLGQMFIVYFYRNSSIPEVCNILKVSIYLLFSILA